MKNIRIWLLLIVWLLLSWTHSFAYNIWNPIQYIQKLYLTNDWQQSGKVNIELNGTNGLIKANKLYVNEICDSNWKNCMNVSTRKKVYTYKWSTGSWWSCSRTCGGWTQTRKVVCKRSDGVIVANSFCDASNKPSTTRSCNTQACPVDGQCWSLNNQTVTNNNSLYNYSRTQLCSRWDVVYDDAWWNDGTYNWRCRWQNGGRIVNCSASKKVYTYRWYTGSWWACSASCGYGTKSRQVYCLRSDWVRVADRRCSGSKPSSSESCYAGSCYTPTKHRSPSLGFVKNWNDWKENRVISIYNSLFNRYPDRGWLNYWTSQIISNGWWYTQLENAIRNAGYSFLRSKGIYNLADTSRVCPYFLGSYYNWWHYDKRADKCRKYY